MERKKYDEVVNSSLRLHMGMRIKHMLCMLFLVCNMNAQKSDTISSDMIAQVIIPELVVPDGVPDNVHEHAFDNFVESFPELTELDKRFLFLYDQNGRAVGKLKNEGALVIKTNEETFCEMESHDAFPEQKKTVAYITLLDTNRYVIDVDHIDDKRGGEAYILEKTDKDELTYVDCFSYLGNLWELGDASLKQQLIDFMRQKVYELDPTIDYKSGALPVPKSYNQFLSTHAGVYHDVDGGCELLELLPMNNKKNLKTQLSSMKMKLQKIAKEYNISEDSLHVSDTEHTSMDVIHYYGDELIYLPTGDTISRGRYLIDKIDGMQVEHEEMKYAILGQMIEESHINPDAESKRGARNILQRMPHYTKYIKRRYKTKLDSLFSDKEQTVDNMFFHVEAALWDAQDRIHYLTHGEFSEGSGYDMDQTHKYDIPENATGGHLYDAVASIEAYTGEELPYTLEKRSDGKKVKAYRRPVSLALEAGHLHIKHLIEKCGMDMNDAYKLAIDMYLTGHVAGSFYPPTIYKDALERMEQDTAFAELLTLELSSCHDNDECIDPYEFICKLYDFVYREKQYKNFRKSSAGYSRIAMSVGKKAYIDFLKRYK